MEGEVEIPVSIVRGAPTPGEGTHAGRPLRGARGSPQWGSGRGSLKPP